MTMASSCRCNRIDWNSHCAAGSPPSISSTPCRTCFTRGFQTATSTKSLDVIRHTPRHTYQILTKRAERLPEYFTRLACPENVWLGVSVEDQAHGVPRIDLLRQVRVPIRFLSIEPLLEDRKRQTISPIAFF
ncbi:DUF5131 family protein [Thiolapillus sp.]|uniref:DUF5131 family protein n=1 Tax=Thiolapillus sp. TaxID=2017437 RepID=UPI003AF74447